MLFVYTGHLYLEPNEYGHSYLHVVSSIPSSWGYSSYSPLERVCPASAPNVSAAPVTSVQLCLQKIFPLKLSCICSLKATFCWRKIGTLSTALITKTMPLSRVSAGTKCTFVTDFWHPTKMQVCVREGGMEPESSVTYSNTTYHLMFYCVLMSVCPTHTTCFSFHTCKA